MSAPLLVAYNRTERASILLDEAFSLSADLGESLLVVCVITDREIEEYRENPPPEGALLDLLVGQVREEVRRTLSSRAPDGHPGVEVEVQTGDPATRLLDEIKRRQPRYVLLGVRSRSRVGKLVFGSTAQALTLASTRPVLCVPLHD